MTRALQSNPDFSGGSTSVKDGEGQTEILKMLLANTPFQVFSYMRPRGKTGGCCAIIFNSSRFTVEQVFVQTEGGIKTVWAMLTPRRPDHRLQQIKRIPIASTKVSNEVRNHGHGT